MAEKIIFIADREKKWVEQIVQYTYVKGLAFSQKQKNVLSFHSSIHNLYPNAPILEVSTKSQADLGVLLSAYNLTINGDVVESVFQSSKVYAGGVQYEEVKHLPSRAARDYLKDKPKCELVKFSLDGVDYPLTPPSMFYDYLYISALCQNESLAKQLLQYQIFTDIEFNEKRQINCQARACAIYVYMATTNTLQYYMQSQDHFKQLYNHTEMRQMSLFE